MVRQTAPNLPLSMAVELSTDPCETGLHSSLLPIFLFLELDPSPCSLALPSSSTSLCSSPSEVRRIIFFSTCLPACVPPNSLLPQTTINASSLASQLANIAQHVLHCDLPIRPSSVLATIRDVKHTFRVDDVHFVLDLPVHRPRCIRTSCASSHGQPRAG